MPTLYCPACNEVFPADDEGCPRCGMTSLRSPARTMDTVLSPRQTATDHRTQIELDEYLLDGQVVDIYECREVLGRGGMGVVYLADNRQLRRPCALKILSPRTSSESIDYLQRFQNEGRAAAALVHPNIVTTHAIGKSGNHHFLEMELVRGESLQQEIDRNGPIGPVRATQISVGIAEGLAAAHRLGIVHRDLKPDNVLVTPAGYPKIADFGLAKQVHAPNLTDARLAGTPHFMAPELFDGSLATPASDVFALGVCMYVMLTGSYPFEGSTLNSLMTSIMSGEYPRVREVNPDVPLDVAECTAQMLSPGPKNRPADGSAASQLLQAVLGSTRDLETLAYEAFDGIPGIEYEADGPRVKIRLQLPNGRGQAVYIENSAHRAGDRLLNIFSVCCESSEDFYEEALRLNAVVLHGGISIREIDGISCFVMVDTYPRATVTAEEIRRSVIEVGSRADDIESLLTGQDVN